MKASEYRRIKAQKSEPTAEIKLPSGFAPTLRRPPLNVWIQAGRVPQSLLRQIMAARDGVEVDLSAEESVQAMTFIRDAIVYAFVSPRLVVGADPESDDELDPSELEPEDFEFLMKWIMANCPGIPVETKGGQVAVEDLNRFRQKRPGGGYVDDQPGSSQVRDEAEQTAAAV